MRRQIAHQAHGIAKSQASMSTVLKTLAGKNHHHSCVERDCRRTYSCGCIYPGVNGRCGPCISPAGPGRRRNKEADEARDPRPCCVNNTAQVTSTDDLLRFQLAGPGPWFQCKTCARCHGRPVTTL